MKRYHSVLFLYAAALAGIILGPLWSNGYWLYNDAVSTPRTYPTAMSYGMADLAPRAVPQDWLLSLITPYIDGGICVKIVTWLGLFLIGAGVTLWVRVFLGAYVLPALAACTFAMLNPYVNERLAQGQWSLLVGIGAAITLTGYLSDYIPNYVNSTTSPLISGNIGNTGNKGKNSNNNSGKRARIQLLGVWGRVVVLAGLANLTVSSGIIAVLMLIPFIGANRSTCRVSDQAQQSAGGSWAQWLHHHRKIMLLMVMIMSACPWIVAGLLAGHTAIVSSVSGVLFRMRSEHTGVLLTEVVLGGIWNAHSTSWFRSHTDIAYIQSFMMLIILMVGSWAWYTTTRTSARRATHTSAPLVSKGLFSVLGNAVCGYQLSGMSVRKRNVHRVFHRYTVLVIVTGVGVAVSASATVMRVWFGCSAMIPGVGVLRDSHKFLAIVIPWMSVIVAYATWWLGRLCGFNNHILRAKKTTLHSAALSAMAAMVGIVGVMFGDSVWGQWGKLGAVKYPIDFPCVSTYINASGGTVVSLPAGIIRRYDFTQRSRSTFGVISLDPFSRMVNAPVRSSGTIRVDGYALDSVSAGVALEHRVLYAKSLAELEQLPISWIIVNNSPSDDWGNFPAVISRISPTYAGNTVRLYHIHSSADVDVSPFSSYHPWWHVRLVKIVYSIWLSGWVIALSVWLLSIVRLRIMGTKDRRACYR